MFMSGVPWRPEKALYFAAPNAHGEAAFAHRYLGNRTVIARHLHPRPWHEVLDRHLECGVDLVGFFRREIDGISVRGFGDGTILQPQRRNSIAIGTSATAMASDRIDAICKPVMSLCWESQGTKDN